MRKPQDSEQLEKRLAALSAREREHPGRPAPTYVARRTIRSEQRETSYRLATILLNGRFGHKAVIRDMSRIGARILLEEMQTLPPVVTLKIAQTGAKIRARVIWQREMEAGLSFEAVN